MPLRARGTPVPLAILAVLCAAAPAGAATDLGIEAAGPDRAFWGDAVTFTATVRNNGAEAAADVVMAFRAGIGDPTFVSAAPSQGECPAGPPRVECRLGTLGSGASASVVLVLRFFDTKRWQVAPRLVLSRPDPDRSNDTASHEVTVRTRRGRCANRRSGTAGDDVPFYGTAAGDRLRGLAGDDFLLARAGDDCLAGGRGDDRLNAGPGDDTLDGGAGDDKLIGDDGSDVLKGGPGRNEYNGGAGNDTIRSRNGVAETVICGAGSDRAIADASDRLLGCERR